MQEVLEFNEIISYALICICVIGGVTLHLVKKNNIKRKERSKTLEEDFNNSNDIQKSKEK